MCNKAGIVLCSVLFCVLNGLHCSNQPVQTVDGGGTETVIGTVVFKGGATTQGIEVKLIPQDCNPVDNTLPDSLISQTSASGAYVFESVHSGTYNILARHFASKLLLFHQSVVVAKDTGTINITADTLYEPGAARIVLPDTVDTVHGLLFIKGTDIAVHLSTGSRQPDGLYTVLLSDLPAADFSALHYLKDSTGQPQAISGRFAVMSRDTALVEAYEYTLVHGSVVYENGVAAAGTIVTAVAADYMPGIDNPLPLTMFDTVSMSGVFEFKITVPGTYNILALHPGDGLQYFRRSVTVSGDTVALQADTLKDPGSLTLIMPDTVDMVHGLISFEGTTIYSPLSQSNWIDTGFHRLIFNALPAARFTSIWYLTDRSKPKLAIDTMTVHSGDALLREAFVRWSHYTKENSGLPSDQVQDMIISADGVRWFGTDAGAVCFDGASWTRFTKANAGLASDTVMSITQTANGAMWFGTVKGVARFHAGLWDTFSTHNSPLPDDSLFEVVSDGANGVWIGTDDGAAHFDGSAGWTVYTTQNSALPHPEVYCIGVDKDGVVWLGTDGGGVVRLEKGSMTIYNEFNSPLPSCAIFSILVDDNNKKWIGTFGGVAVYDGAGWSFIKTGSVTDYKYTVSAIAKDNDGTGWFGSYEGGRIFRYDGSRLITYTTRTCIINTMAFEMFSIRVDAQNYKWVPTTRGGVYVFGPISQ